MACCAGLGAAGGTSEAALDIPRVVVGVVSVGEHYLSDGLVATFGMGQDYGGLIGQSDRLVPGSDRAIQRPQGPGQRESLVFARLCQQVGVVGSDGTSCSSRRSGEALRPDTEVVDDVTDVGLGRPGQIRMPLGAVQPAQQRRVSLGDGADEFDCLIRFDRPLVPAVATRVSVGGLGPLVHGPSLLSSRPPGNNPITLPRPVEILGGRV